MVGKASSLTRRLIRWYRRHRRDLPWRVAPGSPAGVRPDPYHVLVSEAMLQQTQVTTVVPYFRRFLERFPTIRDLADADEQDVLRLWQGLGYYSRARNLRLAARFVGERFGGQIPPNVEDLRRLPGVGRYTAGAVASLAFDRCAPIVDGNVARVVCRIDRIETDPRDRATLELLWTRAAELVPASCPGDFNSALMELGATVCTPRAPKCLLCPVQQHCEAFADGVQERIPVPREDKPRPLLRRRTYCVRRTDPGGVVRWLIEQRPPKGRWAGMWQFITRAPGEPLAGWRTTRPRRIGKVLHELTHRRYEFDVYVGDARPEDGAPVVPGPSALRPVAPVRWVDLGELDGYPLPRPHLRIAQMLRETLPARPIAPGKAVRQTR